MHPILARSRRLLLYLLLFVPVALLAAELLKLAAGGDRFALWLALQPPLLIHAMSCLASFYFCRSLPLTPESLPRVLLAQLAAAVTAAALVLALTTGWARQLDGFGIGGVAAPVERGAVLVFLLAFVLAAVAAASHYVYLAVLASEEAERGAFELRLFAQDAELRALRAQLDPHFLFNSLNSISALIGAEPQKARTMCGHLAEFLRQSLRKGALGTIPLREELSLAQSYLAVEQIRFGPRLAVRLDIAPGVEDLELPPLLLQPLVENAVRHGLAHLLDGGELRLAARREGGELLLEIGNDCDPERPRGAGGGLGLANVRGRLAAIFGDRAALRVVETPQSYEVALRLPASTADPAADEEPG